MNSEQDPQIEATSVVQEQATLCAEGVTSLVASGQALMGGCQAISGAMIAFWQSRLKEGLTTGQRLLECDSAEGALEIQLDYAKAALQAYRDQSARIGHLMSRSLADGLSPRKVPPAPAPAAAA
jgi:hypothetical protein